jgi:morphogenetic protein associated with SpoVID
MVKCLLCCINCKVILIWHVSGYQENAEEVFELKIHMVKSGDTLYEIAQKYNVDLEKLIASNPQIADPNVIEVGMKVKIPNAPTPVLPPTDYLHKHVVVQGDTLWKLGKSWNVPLQMLIKANPQLKNPNILMTGEVVYIPKMKTAPATDQHEHMQQHHQDHQHDHQQDHQQELHHPHGKPNTAPMPVAPIPAPIPQPEAVEMPPFKPMPVPTPMPIPIENQMPMPNQMPISTPMPTPMPTIEYEETQINIMHYPEYTQPSMPYKPMSPTMPTQHMPNCPCEECQMGMMHQMQPYGWDCQQPSMNLFQQYQMPATEAFNYDAMQAPNPSMWGEPLMYPHSVEPSVGAMPYPAYMPTEQAMYPHHYQQQPLMNDCGCGAPVMPWNQATPYGANMYVHPFQQPQEMNYIVMPNNQIQEMPQGMDAAAISSMFPGVMNPMDQMNSMPPMGSMNPMQSMPSMGSMNPMQSMPSMGSMNPMQSMPPMGSMNPMQVQQSMGLMNPMQFQQPSYYGNPYVNEKPGCGCGCHDRAEAVPVNHQTAQEEPKAAISKKAEKASVKSTGTNQNKVSISTRKSQAAKSRRPTHRANKAANRSPWLGR